jgi:PAS domain S-box-containing protein
MGNAHQNDAIEPAKIGLWLAIATCLILAASWLVVYWSIVADREATRTASFRVSQSIALSLEEHVTETMRDASNALVSAALLIEQAGGPRRFTVAQLQHELARELPDRTSVRRLVVIDAGAHTVASSDARQLPSIRVPQREFYQWHAAHPTDTAVHLSHAIKTTVQKEWVIPLSRAIVVDGRFAGMVVAQLDARYFEAFYRKLTALYPATLTLAHADGRLMFRYPFNADFVGRDITPALSWPQVVREPGTIEHVSPLDGRRRFLSHRPIAGRDLVVLVGLDHDEVMAPWLARTRQRVAFAAAASLMFVLLVGLLVAHLRRSARSEARFHGLYNVASDGIVVLRGDKIIDVNPSFVAMLGYSRPDEIIGRSPGEFYPEGAEVAMPRIRERLASVRAGGKSRFEICLRRKDGGKVIAELQLSPFVDQGETLVMALIRDTTERRHAESALQQLTAELEERVERRTAQLSKTLRELESFTYTVSHDLRAPVRHMRSFSAAVQEEFAGVLPPECARMLARIEAAGGRMDALIVGLLALSRVSREPLAITLCDLSAAARSILGTLRDLEPGRRAEIEIEDGLAAEADRGLIEALLENLLGNAWKFSAKADPARIAFGRTQKDGRTVFYVRDNGAGFNMAYAHQLYEPFRRLHAESEFSGTGIGLATVHRIIERHGGEIAAESTPGQGSCFYFSLGLAEETSLPRRERRRTA